jgi:hypothetical protein
MLGKSFYCAAASLLLATPALAQMPDQRGFHVRNDSGETLLCMVRPVGSARTERLSLKADAAWSKSYDGRKDLRLRCEGAYSGWHRLSPGRAYSLLKKGTGMIVVQPTGSR